MGGQEIMAAAIQMSSTPNKVEHLEAVERLIRAAASAGADLVALPEFWTCHGLEAVYRENAEPYPDRPRDSSAASPANWESISSEAPSSKAIPLRQNCIIHRRSYGLPVRCRRYTAGFISLMSSCPTASIWRARR